MDKNQNVCQEMELANRKVYCIRFLFRVETEPLGVAQAGVLKRLASSASRASGKSSCCSLEESLGTAGK